MAGLGVGHQQRGDVAALARNLDDAPARAASGFSFALQRDDVLAIRHRQMQCADPLFDVGRFTAEEIGNLGDRPSMGDAPANVAVVDFRIWPRDAAV